MNADLHKSVNFDLMQFLKSSGIADVVRAQEQAWFRGDPRPQTISFNAEDLIPLVELVEYDRHLYGTED